MMYLYCTFVFDPLFSTFGWMLLAFSLSVLETTAKLKVIESKAEVQNVCGTACQDIVNEEMECEWMSCSERAPQCRTSSAGPVR